MQYSQEHLKTMVYAEFGGKTECIMGNWKIENGNVSRWGNAPCQGRIYVTSPVPIAFYLADVLHH